MIRVELDKCTGCRRCETKCSFFHTAKINNHLSRIKVLHFYEIGIDGPVVCTQCKERYCMCCPNDAMTIGLFGQVIISPTACTLCGACEKACPIGAIELFDSFVYVCDLCGGNPKCVKACTEGAIFWNTKKQEHPSLASYKKQKKNMNPNQKRQTYLKKLSIKIRAIWRKKFA